MAGDAPDTCEICGSPLGGDPRSTYTPYPSHADKTICVRNIRADERGKAYAEGRDYGWQEGYDAAVDRFNMTGRADARERQQAARAERERGSTQTVAWMDRYHAQVEAERQAWTDLRAEVEALPTRGVSVKVDVESQGIVVVPLVIRADVLDLLTRPTQGRR